MIMILNYNVYYVGSKNHIIKKYSTPITFPKSGINFVFKTSKLNNTTLIQQIRSFRPLIHTSCFAIHTSFFGIHTTFFAIHTTFFGIHTTFLSAVLATFHFFIFKTPLKRTFDT